MPTYRIFQHQVIAAQAVCATRPIEVSNLDQAVQAIDNHFRDHILATTIDTDDNPHQAIQVEINKQLRLLKTDRLFLRSAKQPHMVEQRLQQMTDRLTLLERYCEMILG